jgi:hypothetical protein
MSGIIGDNVGRSGGLIKAAAGGGATVDTWINFNGTGTIAISDSSNISSITDNAVGEYTVTVITAMPHANYAIVGSSAEDETGSFSNHLGLQLARDALTDSAFKVDTANTAGAARDHILLCAVVVHS